MQLTQSASHDVASKMSGGQHRECCWREYEREKDQTADPDDQRKEHEKTEEGHVVENYILTPIETSKLATDH